MESLYYIISGVQPAAECKLAPESRSVVYKCDDCCCAASWQCASPPAVTCAAWRWPAVPAAPTAAAHHPQHSHKPQSPALSCNQRHVIVNSIKITAPESPAKLQGWMGGKGEREGLQCEGPEKNTGWELLARGRTLTGECAPAAAGADSHSQCFSKLHVLHLSPSSSSSSGSAVHCSLRDPADTQYYRWRVKYTDVYESKSHGPLRPR